MVQNLIKKDNPDPEETDKKGPNPHCKPLETDMKETAKTWRPTAINLLDQESMFKTITSQLKSQQ